MSFLIDTNVLSEIRKGPRADLGVQAWFENVEPDELFVSVLILGEIRRGIELKRPRDPAQAQHLDAWLTQLTEEFSGRLVPISPAIADAWGRFGVPNALPAVDGLLAATAHVHRLILVTRNTKDFERAGIMLLNPFSA